MVWPGKRLQAVEPDQVLLPPSLRAMAAGNAPGRRTICRFRERHLKDFENAFVQLAQLAREAELVSMGTIAVDGTKIRADASKRKAKRSRPSRRPLRRRLTTRSGREWDARRAGRAHTSRRMSERGPPGRSMETCPAGEVHAERPTWRRAAPRRRLSSTPAPLVSCCGVRKRRSAASKLAAGA